MIRFLFWGDVDGEPGRKTLANRLKGLRLAVGSCIPNGENAAG
jgi:calcineurin-like phosphoesterase